MEVGGSTQDIAMHGATARYLGEQGALFFGPGPRKWTLVSPYTGFTYSLSILGVDYSETGPIWKLRAKRVA